MLREKKSNIQICRTTQERSESVRGDYWSSKSYIGLGYTGHISRTTILDSLILVLVLVLVLLVPVHAHAFWNEAAIHDLLG